MTTAYPSGQDSFTRPLPGNNRGSTPTEISVVNNAMDAIEAIEGELGVNPSGASATVVARLDALDTTVAGKQAGDATLTALAGVTTAANKVIYATGSDTFTTADLTAAGRALIDDADATAQRTTLGLGSIATQASSSVSITGGSVTGITDLAVADGGTGGSTAATARTNLDAQRRGMFDVRDYGAVGDGSTDDKAAFVAAATAAHAMGGAVFIPAGRWAVAGGLDLSAYDISIIGVGSGESASYPNNLVGSVIVATSQTTAVLKISSLANNHTGRRIISGFGVEGDSSAGAAKVGVFFDAVTGASVSDIVVKRTGGAAFDFSGCQLCSFDRLIARQPVNAGSTGIPYYTATGPTNGNTFTACGLRRVSSVGDTVDPAACVDFRDDATYTPEQNVFVSWWFEANSVPAGGALFALRGNNNQIRDFAYFDIVYADSATTSGILFASTASGGPNYGGNKYDGFAQGSSGTANYGIRVAQSGNTIFATKGYNGHCVKLESGVARTTVILTGSQSGATAAGVTDSSGTTSNLILDSPATKPVVTGSRGSNAALASLITALATIGFITDSSS